MYTEHMTAIEAKIAQALKNNFLHKLCLRFSN